MSLGVRQDDLLLKASHVDKHSRHLTPSKRALAVTWIHPPDPTYKRAEDGTVAHVSRRACSFPRVWTA